ncbi:MAG: HD-GYP domain-containing protein [Pseudomonadaceae bacterium]|nr:MAG: HD-GYP domain-containing protein [Pseudomonadaceae bacterium]
MKQIQVVKITTDRLCLGMYVSELDCSWLQTPFPLQGILLKNDDDLLTLRALCEQVGIDVKKSLLSSQDIRAIAKAPPRLTSKTYPILTTTEDELEVASEHYQSSLQEIERLLGEVANGQPLRSQQVIGAVHECLESIIRNPSAMLWLSRIKHADRYTAEHCLNVGILAMNFGRHLGLGRQYIEWLGLCGMLHDVGKMQVSAALLNKPGRLTPDEFDQVKKHAEYGYQALRDDPTLPPAVLEAVYSHHERLDGTGYPRGLRDVAIGFFTRVTSIVDAYDAITSQRCYSPAESSAKALSILYNNRGSQFDSRMVEYFIQSVGLYAPGAIIELNNGERAVIIASNPAPDLRLCPKVAVVRDAKGHAVQERIVDLAAERTRPPEQQLRIKRLLTLDESGIDLESFTRQTLNQNLTA